MKIKNVEVKIVQGDITELAVEAIVNPTRGQLVMDAGLAGIIKEKGGVVIEEEVGARAPVPPGEAVWSHAGDLKAEYVIHVVTVGDDLKTNEYIIRAACGSVLRCADELHVTTLAIPALGCGVGDFAVIGAAKIMAQEILKFVKGAEHELGLREIVLCLYDKETFQTFENTVSGYVTHIQDTLGDGPYVTVDAIIELDEGIILIERSNPPYGWALPGGFVDYGESLEEAVAREAMEETNMGLTDLRQFHTYSQPDRDPRFHTVSTAFIARGVGRPQFGDDAKGLKVVKYEDLPDLEYAFDHKRIIGDYLKLKF